MAEFNQIKILNYQIESDSRFIIYSEERTLCNF